MAPARADTAALRRLEPEPWGSRLTRARESSRHSPTQSDVARAVSTATGIPISPATISRLESQPLAPFHRKRRRIAYLLSMLYELDPAELDLGPEDSPDPDDRKRFTTALMRAVISRYAGDNRDNIHFLMAA